MIYTLMLTFVGLAICLYTALDINSEKALLLLVKSFGVDIHFKITDRPSPGYSSDVRYLQDAVNGEMQRVTAENTSTAAKLVKFKRTNLCRLILLWLTAALLASQIFNGVSVHFISTYLRDAIDIFIGFSIVFAVLPINVKVPNITAKNTFVCLIPPKDIDNAEFRHIASQYIKSN